MVKLILRDDDCNFFSNPKDIENVYGQLYDFPISFAIVPTVIDVSTIGACPETKGNLSPQYIGNNEELCNWLKKKYSEGKCDILMHGITHSYVTHPARLAEMEWRTNEPNLSNKLLDYKIKLENLLNCNISIFVAPSNKISSYCLKAVEAAGMHFSGIVPFKFNQRVTINNIKIYLKRWIFRCIYNLPYPGVLRYTYHNELNACIPVSLEYLKRTYSICKKKNLPMAINVHYWDLRENPEKLKMIVDFVNYAIADGAIPTKMSNCIK